MDDYISKPVQPNNLADVIGKWGDKKNKISTRTGLDKARLNNKKFDRKAILNRLGGDEDFLNKIVKTFIEDMPNKICIMKKSLAEKDTNRIKQRAHALNGASSTICAIAL